MRATLMIIVACMLLILAVMLVVPIGVNLPDSWFGVVLMGVLIAAAGVLLYKAVNLIKQHGNARTP